MLYECWVIKCLFTLIYYLLYEFINLSWLYDYLIVWIMLQKWKVLCLILEVKCKRGLAIPNFASITGWFSTICSRCRLRLGRWFMDNGLLLNEDKLILQLKLRNIPFDFEIGTYIKSSDIVRPNPWYNFVDHIAHLNKELNSTR